MERFQEIKKTGWMIVAGGVLIYLALQTMIFLVWAKWEVYLRLISCLYKNTSGLIHPNLVNGIFIFMVVFFGVILGWANLRSKDIGLQPKKIFPALIMMVGIWLFIQVFLMAFSLLQKGSITIHPGWLGDQVFSTIGFFIAMLMGIALVEEMFFRGFVLPQLFLIFRIQLKVGERSAMAWSVLLSSIFFALIHIPSWLSPFGGTGPSSNMFIDLVILTAAGVFFCLVYIRSGNLFFGVGIHALADAPISLFVSSFDPYIVFAGLIILILIFWPSTNRIEKTKISI